MKEEKLQYLCMFKHRVKDRLSSDNRGGGPFNDFLLPLSFQFPSPQGQDVGGAEKENETWGGGGGCEPTRNLVNTI